MKALKKLAVVVLVGAGSLWVGGPRARADASTFNWVHFVQPTRWSVGLEPVVTLTNGAGVGFNGRFTYGLNELSNAQIILGTGTGPMQFRAGGVMTFDFFPDISGQPGIGLATQALFYTTALASNFELSAAPYIHKTVVSGANEIEPFLAIPLGINLSNGAYQIVARAQAGAMFKMTEALRATLEVDVGISSSDSGVAGGVTYFY